MRTIKEGEMTSLKDLGEFYVNWDKDTYGAKPDDNFIIGHIHSELSEAFECLRKKEDTLWFNADKNFKPEGLGPELADVLILTAKLAALHCIDLERMIKLKHDYNITGRSKTTKE